MFARGLGRRGHTGSFRSDAGLAFAAGAVVASPWPLAIAIFILGFGVAFAATLFVLSRRAIALGNGTGRLPPNSAADGDSSPNAPGRSMGVEALAGLGDVHDSAAIPAANPGHDVQRIGLEVEPMAAQSADNAKAAELAAKLRDAYRAGRLTRALYERNVRALGLEPEPEVAPVVTVSSTPIVNAPPPPPADDRIARLHRAYREGRLSRELYEKNVRAIGGEPEPVAVAPPQASSAADRLAKIRAAYEAGRITREAYEVNVRALGGTVEPVAPDAPVAPPPPPSAPAAPEAQAPPLPPPPEEVRAPTALTVEERAAKLRAAYEAGRISREQFRENLRKLGAAAPEAAASEASAQEVPAQEVPAPETPASAPPPPMEEPPAPEAPLPPAEVVNPPAPALVSVPPHSDFDARVDVLTQMFLEGKISRGVYERNLVRAYESIDPRFAELRVAHEEGRITKDAYDAGVRHLIEERGAK